MDQFRAERKETIVSTCGLLGVSRQVYYRSNRSNQVHRQRAQQVVSMVLEIRRRMPRIGTRKLYYLLQEPLKGMGVGRDKLFSILKANHLDIVPKRSYRTTTNSHHRFHKHKNLVEQLSLTRPEQVWASDITYIGSRQRHNYLALVTDVYSKKVMGYDLSNSLSVEGTLRALKMAVKQRMYKSEALIHHSTVVSSIAAMITKNYLSKKRSPAP